MKDLIFNKQYRLFFIITIPAVFLFTLLFTVPVLQGIFYSFTNWNGLAKTYDFIGLDNYIKMFQDNRVMSTFGFTARYTFILVLVVLTLAMIIALILAYFVSKKLTVTLRSIYFFPAVLSMVVVGLVFNEIFYRVVPQIGQALGIGWLSQNILGSIDLAIYGILFVNVWQGTAIPFVLFLTGLKSIPRDIYDAALVDGATPFQIFTKITIPFLLPTINVAFVLTLRSGIMVFDYIQAMTGGGPVRATESASVLIYNLSFLSGKMGYATSISTVMLLVIALISLVQINISKRFEVGQI